MPVWCWRHRISRASGIATFLAVVLTVAQGAPLVVRRCSPLPVLAVVWSATAAYFDLGYPPFATALAGLAVATYAFAAYEAPRPAPPRSGASWSPRWASPS